MISDTVLVALIGALPAAFGAIVSLVNRHDISRHDRFVRTTIADREQEWRQGMPDRRTGPPDRRHDENAGEPNA